MTHETNVDFLTRVSEWGCPTGPLVQPFIMHAIEHYCDEVLKHDASAFDTPFLSGEAWLKTAQWCKGEFNKRYAKG